MLCVATVMVQRLTYSIVDQADGRFDILVLLGSRSLYSRTGLMTLTAAEEEIDLLRALMAPLGAPVVQWTGIADLPLTCARF